MNTEPRLPKHTETFNQILEVLAGNQIISTKELRRKVIAKYYAHLPEHLLNETLSSGKNRIEDRIDWGKSYLKMADYLHHPQRGYVQITAKGQRVISNNILLSVKARKVIASQNPAVISNNDLNNDAEKVDDLSPKELIDIGISAIEQQIQTELLSTLQKTQPYHFEKIVLKLLEKMGYGEYLTTSKSRDGGIDGIINEDKLGLDKIYIQAKRFAADNKVREPDIRNFIGAMSSDTNKGVFVTTSTFDKAAEDKANKASQKIVLIDGAKLVKLMYQFNVGVQIEQSYDIKKLDEDFFSE